MTQHKRGIAHHACKLTEQQVLAIRRRYGRGETLRELSLAFSQVSKPAIHHVIHGNHWAYLPSVAMLRSRRV